MREPKILLLDIETSPILGYAWGLFDQNIALNQIHTDWFVLSWSAKWLDAPNVMYMDQRNAKVMSNDKRILKGIWDLLNEADVIITQNGKKFDQKKLNARFVIHGFQPPSHVQHIDTLSIAKKRFGFTSNKLAYMTDKLCTQYKKQEHRAFAGFELWKECLARNPKAWKAMETYNKYDVLSLEELYKKLRPWDNSVNLNVYRDGAPDRCACGESSFYRRGFYYTQVGKFQKFRCRSCGAEMKTGVNLLAKGGKDRLRGIK